jgi:hypothetical protein
LIELAVLALQDAAQRGFAARGLTSESVGRDCGAAIPDAQDLNSDHGLEHARAIRESTKAGAEEPWTRAQAERWSLLWTILPSEAGSWPALKRRGIDAASRRARRAILIQRLLSR